MNGTEFVLLTVFGIKTLLVGNKIMLGCLQVIWHCKLLCIWNTMEKTLCFFSEAHQMPSSLQNCYTPTSETGCNSAPSAQLCGSFCKYPSLTALLVILFCMAFAIILMPFIISCSRDIRLDNGFIFLVSWKMFILETWIYYLLIANKLQLLKYGATGEYWQLPLCKNQLINLKQSILNVWFKNKHMSGPILLIT